jgi:hypothetical protein
VGVDHACRRNPIPHGALNALHLVQQGPTTPSQACVEFALVEPRGKSTPVGERINMLRMMNGQLVRLLSMSTAS